MTLYHLETYTQSFYMTDIDGKEYGLQHVA